MEYTPAPLLGVFALVTYTLTFPRLEPYTEGQSLTDADAQPLLDADGNLLFEADQV